MQISKRTPGSPKLAWLEGRAAAAESSERWFRLCELYLPLTFDGTFWRSNRFAGPDEPTQGWKLHISSTVIQACDLFEKVAPFLTDRGLRFKAPDSLRELVKINSGLDYGYWQVGKFLTVYPPTEEQAVRLAAELHHLTIEFIGIAVPFDQRYLPKSSVFYRYGAFTEIEIKDENGMRSSAVKNSSGKLVPDDRLTPVPEWLADPFQKNTKIIEDICETPETPLRTTYRIFKAITQRGKGGTYKAVDLSTDPPRLCVIKEGRRHGEVFWNGQDGHDLVRNEQEVLTHLGKAYSGVPRVLSSFEADGNSYLAIEYIEGKSLYDLIKFRRRRLPVKQVLGFAVQIARIIEEIHEANWVWNDCKPANLIITTKNSLRPIDFEGAYPVGRSAPFDWRSYGFSKPRNEQSPCEADDLYALGAVIYFLLTGKFFDLDEPVEIEHLRPKVPERFRDIIKQLLNPSGFGTKRTAPAIRARLERAAHAFT